MAQTCYADAHGCNRKGKLFSQIDTISGACTTFGSATVQIQKFHVALGQLLETFFHEAKPSCFLATPPFIFLEILKESCALPRINAHLFLNYESRNPKAKFINIRHLSTSCNPSGRTIQIYVGSSIRVSESIKPKKARQFLMKTEIPATCFLRIRRTKKRQ